MIISQYPVEKKNLAIDNKISQLAKDRADRLTKDALADLTKLRDRMRWARRTYREIFEENPAFSGFLKKQIDELTQIIERVGKQVGDLYVAD